MRQGWRKFYFEKDAMKRESVFSFKRLKEKAEKDPASLTEEECEKLHEFQELILVK